MTLTKITAGAATHALHRLARRRLIVPLKRGLWASRITEPNDPMEAVAYLTAPWPSYISLYSALARRGVIDEIPSVIYAVSAGRPARYSNALGEFRIHHLPTHFFWGFQTERLGTSVFLLAEAEKALLDLAYLGLIPRSPLGLPYKRDHRWNLDARKLVRYAKRFHFPPLERYVRALLPNVR